MPLKNERVSSMILGAVASPGVARGQALVCDCADRNVVPRRRLTDRQAKDEVDRFNAAMTAAEAQLLDVQQGVEKALGRREAEIFEAQILLLRDERLHKLVQRLCLEGRINAEAAVEDAIDRLMAIFGRLNDPYFRERATDLHDVGRRILDHLAGDQPPLSSYPEGSIVVLKELLSSAVAQLGPNTIRGLIVEKGGVTTHASILARARGIPMLVHVEGASQTICQGDTIILDALAGRIFINPRSDIARKYEQLDRDLTAHRSTLKGLVDSPSATRDGTEITLAANVGQTADAVAAARIKAHGAGLYRTEFVFLVRDHFPSEEEQCRFYRATAEHFAPNETVVRVLDIGSDKTLPFLPMPHETNPALGCRGMRFLLAHPELLRTQLRAILRTSASHPVSILLPMIIGLDDLREAKAAIDDARAQLKAEGLPFNPRTPVGAMIETPAAAVLVRAIAAEVDFINVGTNDLVQYLLASDRGSDEMDSSYEPLHPAVIHALASIIDACTAVKKPACLCGEMASEPAFTLLLLGLGFRHFSVSTGRLLEVKYVIRSADMTEAENFAKTILQANTLEEIRKQVDADWARRRPVSAPEISAARPAAI